ncbi:hypothetical protein LJB91_02140 [Bacteroidales bacterium OttesenSCG-928-L03]|nr:hypothetical protein [Bacteroidales bacterium OttesenSCG-928-L03]
MKKKILILLMGVLLIGSSVGFAEDYSISSDFIELNGSQSFAIGDGYHNNEIYSPYQGEYLEYETVNPTPSYSPLMRVPAPAGTLCPNCFDDIQLNDSGVCPKCGYVYTGDSTSTGTRNPTPIQDNASIFALIGALYLGVILFRMLRKEKEVQTEE